MVGAEEFRLPLDEPAPDALEERVGWIEEPGAMKASRPVAGLMDSGGGEHLFDRLGHVPGKALQHRDHSQRTLARENLALERDVTVDPRVGQRPTEPVDVPHPAPREVGGPDEKI